MECSEFADGTPLTIPVVVVHGKEPGPVLLLQAASHGDEVTGTFIAREVAANLDPKTLKGTLVAIPIANVPAYLTRSRGFLHEERSPINMAGAFPGNMKGLLTERLAYTIFNELILRSNYVIDLHTGLTGAICYPFIYVVPADNRYNTLEVREVMAKISGVPLVYRLSREKVATFRSSASGDYDKTFGGQCEKRGIPRLLLEMGEGGRITKEFLPTGKQAILNIMKYLHMIPGDPEPSEAKQFYFTEFEEVLSNRGGLLSIEASLGSRIKKGDLIAKVYGPLDVIEEIVTPVDGVVLRIMTHGIIYPGAEVAWIAKGVGE
jgi:predicted deacylase